MLEGGLDQARPAGEVVVEERGGDARLGGDVLDAQAAHPAAGDHPRDGDEDRLAMSRGLASGGRSALMPFTASPSGLAMQAAILAERGGAQ